MSEPDEPTIPTSLFGKAAVKAVIEAERYLAAEGSSQADLETGERYAALSAAQDIAQGYGVVLSVALVAEILKALRGESTRFDSFEWDGLPLDELVANQLESAEQKLTGEKP